MSDTETIQDRFARLREKAGNLPLSPGVYLMKDRDEKIIYVGKSRALRNRVSQYFAPIASHGVKTEHMTHAVSDFEVILTTSETEALALENRLIKLHTPRYNIKLKDDRNYPYLKITLSAEYPVLSVVRKRSDDGARYFGPYSGTGAAYTILNTIRKSFGIPSCKRSFPRDIGKGRPCLNHQIGQCAGVCTGALSQKEYHEAYEHAAALLSGSYADVMASLREKMEFASDNLQFEAAARYRDRINELKRLWEKQRVLAAPDTEQDVIAFYRDDVCPVLTVLSIRSGALLDSESFAFPSETIDDEDDLTTVLLDLYCRRAQIPREILLGFPIGEENRVALAALLSEELGKSVTLRVPERGDARALCKMALDNARQYSLASRQKTEKDGDTLIRLAQLLALEVVPEKIESFDISNLGSEWITAGKIACVNGSFQKSGYRTYRIESAEGQDDYAAMREAVDRRLSHPEDPLPDLFLLDGGKAHVSVIRDLLAERGIPIPVAGMVKDDHHKTRALVNSDGEEIDLSAEPAVFILLYGIQEEVHRFTISRMTDAKRKTIRTSSLESIPGVGPAKARALLAHFHTLDAIRHATPEQLTEVKGISETIARTICASFPDR